MHLGPINLEDIPGYLDAIRTENELRAAAFIPDFREFVCGVEVLPLSMGHLAALQVAESPFVGGEISPTPDHCGQFLWIVSPQFEISKAMRKWVGTVFPPLGNWLFNRIRDRFARTIANQDQLKLFAEVIRYIDTAFMDCPGRVASTGFKIPDYCAQVSMVNVLGAEYGWSASEIVTMPLRHTFQFLRLIEKRNNPQAIFFNPSDRVRREGLQKMIEERKAQDA